MIYDYRCPHCQIVYDIWQKISDRHQYECPVCLQKCVREWNESPSMQISQGFFTEQFRKGGEWVSGQKEYNRRLAQVRTESGMDKYLGVNKANPEHVGNRRKKIEADRKRASRELADTEEHVYNAVRQGKMD